MSKTKIDPYDKLFLNESEVLLAKARSKMAKELCKCGHEYRVHDHYLNLCNAKAPNKRNTCECIEFRGKMSLIDCLIRVVQEEEQKKIFQRINELKVIKDGYR